ncbi:MAG: efflux RND transporter periplasmic adaptor subunit [Gammaproteobacteria bacterium]|jgi:cobalt-zinc-cadmium efflux system membrane fusion protein
MRFAGLVVMGLLALALTACGGPAGGSQEHGHEHGGDHGHDDEPEGPNGGRLLTDGDVTIEIRIVDQANNPPRFRAWVTQNGKPLTGSIEQLAVRTERLGGEAEGFELVAKDGAFSSIGGVREPHSFKVKVSARIGGRNLEWAFDSFEGRVSIDAASAKEAGITTAPVGSATVRQTVQAPGVVRPRESGRAQVIARFPGVIKAVRVDAGDRVAAGAVLATIDSNASLSTYPVTAPISGTIITHAATVGAAVADQPLFEIANTDVLQVDLSLFGAAVRQIKTGAKVKVQRLFDDVLVETEIVLVLPDVDVSSQSVVAQALVKNTDGLWRPGVAVQAEIELSRADVPLAVPVEALQTWRDMTVVFIRVGDIYEVRPVSLGRRDRERVEILSGVQSGDEVVIGQSYLIKADIEKSGATHDH